MNLVENALNELGIETNWEADVVTTGTGRLLIIRDGKAVGEVLQPSGGLFFFPQPLDAEELM